MTWFTMIARHGYKKMHPGKSVFTLCLTLLALCFSVSQAYADVDLSTCASGWSVDGSQLTGPIVNCVKTAIVGSVIAALQNLSDYFKDTTAVVFVLAVTMHGAKILSGERGMNGKSAFLLLKIAFVALFSYNLGGYATMAFDIMDEIVTIVVTAIGGSASPWALIDKILGILFGFAPGIALYQGLVWLGSGLASGTANFGAASGLIVAFIELILFVVEIVYTYLTAYIVVAFMVILSPMFIPMIMFQASERYFRKWLDTILGAMLVPVLLFAMLSFTMTLYSTLITNVFRSMIPGYSYGDPADFSNFWKINQPLFSFNMGVDPDLVNDEQKAQNAGTGPKSHMAPSSHVIINPFSRGGFDANAFNPPVINFGINNNQISQKLLLNLIALWLYTAILKELIEKMPEIAQEIAGAAKSITLRAPKLEDKVNEVKQDIAIGSGTLAGGLAGGQLAATSGSKRITEAGAIGGGIIGNVLARKFI